MSWNLAAFVVGYLLGRGSSGGGGAIPPIPIPGTGKSTPAVPVPFPFPLPTIPPDVVPPIPVPNPVTTPSTVAPQTAVPVVQPVQTNAFQYTIQDGDIPVEVARRFTGTVQRPDGRFTWKELDSASPPLKTTSANADPWRAGLTLVLPKNWQQDSGPRSGARGQAVPVTVSGVAVVGIAEPPLSTV